MTRGGFKAKVISTRKAGQVHFIWKGDFAKLENKFPQLEKMLRKNAKPITQNMEKRGGGVMHIHLENKSHLEDNYYQLNVTFETCDSMGANFINSVLEDFAKTLQNFIILDNDFADAEKDVMILMSILSNYTPDCLVRAWVECPVEKLS